MNLDVFSDTIISSLVFLYLFCNIHVTGVTTELEVANTSGALGLASITEVHLLTQFRHIEHLTDLRLRNTTWYFKYNRMLL